MINDETDAMMAMPAMALGSVPTSVLSSGGQVNEQIKVVENANVTDNLTIDTPIPIHFKTDSVHVGGLAPAFVPDVTLTLEAGVVLMFERALHRADAHNVRRRRAGFRTRTRRWS